MATTNWTGVSRGVSNTHTNTTTETGFTATHRGVTSAIAIPIPKGLALGTTIDIVASIVASATNGGDTLTSNLRLVSTVADAVAGPTATEVAAGTALVTTGAIDVANGDPLLLRALGIVTAHTFGGGGTIDWVTEVTTATAGATHVVSDVQTTSVDDGVQLYVGASSDWSAASASNVCALRFLLVRVSDAVAFPRP